MALSKKKSRPIVVDGQGYRWQFFENWGWNDVTIQCAEGTGPKLVIQFPWDHSPPPYISFLPPVTPSKVSELIQNAIGQGWRPLSSDKTMNMKYVDGQLEHLTSGKAKSNGL